MSLELRQRRLLAALATHDGEVPNDVLATAVQTPPGIAFGPMVRVFEVGLAVQTPSGWKLEDWVLPLAREDLASSVHVALVIRFLNVGEGDAVLITGPDGQTVLYDGGPSEACMCKFIRSLPISRLDVAVSSHADSDYSTDLIPAVGLLKLRYFINNGLAGDTQIWTRLLNVAAQAGVPGPKAARQTLKMSGSGH